MKKQINGTTVAFTFAEGVAPVIFDATKASAANRAYAEMHGWSAAIGDGAALSRKDKDGNVITITEAMRRESVLEKVTHYESGGDAWERRAVRVIAQNPTWLAIAEKRGVSYETVAAEKASADLEELSQM